MLSRTLLLPAVSWHMPAAGVDRVPSADLVARLSSDLDQTTTFLQGGGIQLLTNSAQLLVAAAVMTVYSWVLTVPVLLLAVVIDSLSRRSRAASGMA